MPDDKKTNQKGRGKKTESEEPTGQDPGKNSGLKESTNSKTGEDKESKEPTRPELEEERDKCKQKFDEAQKKLDDFDAANKEIDKAVEEYGKVFEKLKSERADLDDYFTKKSLMIAAVVDAKKADEIKKVVKDIGKDIKAAETSSKNAFDKAKGDYEGAVTTLKEFQEKYEAAKGFQKEIETRLKTLDNNRKSIEQEEEEKNYAVMYYLNDMESKKVLKDLNDSCVNLKKLLKDEIPDDDPGRQKFIEDAENEFRVVFKNKLNEAKNALEDKEKDLKLEEKKEKMQEAEKAYNEAQKALADFNKDKKSKLLEELRKIEFKEEV